MLNSLEGPAVRSVEEVLQETIAVKQAILVDQSLLSRVRDASAAIVESYRHGGKVFFCGNGGSAADAQHFAAEFTGHFLIERPPLAAEVLHGNPSHMTAVANDYDYSTVFSRALEASSRSGDVLVAISTSGNSESIVKAAEVGRDRKLTVIAMTGSTGGRLREYANILLNVPSSDTGRIQESHVTFLHAIAESVEYTLFGTS